MMKTTLIGLEQNSNMQQMGETREPMSKDCWMQAQELASKYSEKMKRDFWILYAGKPHRTIPNAIVCGWEVIARRPPTAMVGVLVFKWTHKDQALSVDSYMSLPPDVPISESELSKDSKDFISSLAVAGQKSGSILLA